MNKRLVLGAGDLLGCGFYRLAMPYKNLALKHNFNAVLTNRIDMNLDPDNDILVLQRQHADGILAITEDFVKRGGKVVFELDDYFHDLPANNPARKAYPKGGRELANLERFMELSHLMTVSTPSLGDNYKKWAKNVQICYNKIDTNEFPIVQKREDDGIIRLGWAGSATHLDDLMPIVKPITEIMREFKNVHFVFVGMDYKNLFDFDIRNRMSHAGHTFPMHNGKALFYSEDGTNPVVQYYELLQKANIDIAIAPLLGVTFNRSKSYIKLIEYGMAKIPFVATSFGPYFQYVRGLDVNREYTGDNSVGFLAETNSHWKKHLKALIQSKELREKIAENNHQNIMKNHTIQSGSEQWLNALATIDVIPGDEPGSYQENIVKMH